MSAVKSDSTEAIAVDDSSVDMEDATIASSCGRKRTRKESHRNNNGVADDPNGSSGNTRLKRAASTKSDGAEKTSGQTAGDFEEILQQIGNYGKYQKKIIYWFLYPQACFLPFFVMTIFLQMHVPDHWCAVPGREKTDMTVEEWKNLTIPRKNRTGEFYKCSSYDLSPIEEEISFREMEGGMPLTFEEAIEQRPKTTKKCEDWEFDETHYTLTAPADYKWVCDQRHYGTLALTIQNIGGVFSTLILGPMADIVGRKPVYFLTVGLQMVFGVSSIFAPEFYSYTIMTFMRALAFPAVWQAMFVLAMEIVGPKQRAMINGVLNLTWTVGVCALSLVAYLCKGHWVILALIGNVPLVLCFGYLWLVAESPRWLAQRNRIEEAADILLDIAKQNGTMERLGSKEKVVEELRRLNEGKSKPLNVSFWHLFRRPKLRVRTLIITYGYTVIMILYYGLHLNIASLGGDPYLNFALLGFFEFPAYVASWWAMDRYGRRWVNALNLLIAGAGCIFVALTPKDHWLVIVWSILGKFGSSGGFVLIYQQGCEIFPTVLRSTGLGFMSLVGAAVNTGVPQLIFWGEVYHYSIPYVVFGIMSLLGVIFAAFLPETLNKDLPETVEDSESFGLDQSFWSMNLTKNTTTKDDNSSDASSDDQNHQPTVNITKNPCFRSFDEDEDVEVVYQVHPRLRATLGAYNNDSFEEETTFSYIQTQNTLNNGFRGNVRTRPEHFEREYLT